MMDSAMFKLLRSGVGGALDNWTIAVSCDDDTASSGNVTFVGFEAAAPSIGMVTSLELESLEAWRRSKLDDRTKLRQLMLLFIGLGTDILIRLPFVYSKGRI